MMAASLVDPHVFINTKENHTIPKEDIIVDVLRRIWLENHYELHFLGHNVFATISLGKPGVSVDSTIF